MKRLLLFTGSILCVLLLSGRFAVADWPIEVIPLKSRPVGDILPVIRPLLGAGETATGMGSTLILKAAPEHVREIRNLLVEIDHPPRRLVITVGKRGDAARDQSGYSASADIRAGDAQIGINSPGRPVDETRASVRFHGSSDQRAQDASYSVQALEGRPAFIASGSRFPVVVRRHYQPGRFPYGQRVTELQDASSGFYVVPRLAGDFVTLEIQQRDDRPGNRRGYIDTQGVATTVRGRLGEWIGLGGIDVSSRGSQQGLGRALDSSSSDVQQIEVRVDCLDCGGGVEQYREFLPGLHGFDGQP